MDSEIDYFSKNLCAHLKEKVEYSFNFLLIQKRLSEFDMVANTKLPLF